MGRNNIRNWFFIAIIFITILSSGSIYSYASSLNTPKKASPQNAKSKFIPGFRLYQSDGFSIQLPTGWSNMSSKIDYTLSGDQFSLDSKKIPTSETYTITYKADDGINYDTSIKIIPKASFEKDKSYYLFETGFKNTSIKNAKSAYELKKISCSMIEPSTYKVIALRGDVCYIVLGYFKGYSQMEASGAYYDFNKKRLQKYLNDIKTMISSFKLSDKAVNFSTITKNEQDSISLK